MSRSEDGPAHGDATNNTRVIKVGSRVRGSHHIFKAYFISGATTG